MSKSTNLKKRVIPSILVSNYHVTKSKFFSDHRIFGNLVQTVELFRRRKVDELAIIDIECSKKKIPIDSRILSLMTSNSLIPITYGGGIKNLYDIEKCLNTGCEKIVINSILFDDIKFLKEAVKNFGSQSIIVNIDIKTENNTLNVFNHSKNQIENILLTDHVNICQEYNCGEIIINSVDKDGSMSGYDKTLINKLRPIINKPIIINGGCGNPSDMKEAIDLGADACMAGSIFFFTRYSYKDIKNYLNKNYINVRI